MRRNHKEYVKWKHLKAKNFNQKPLWNEKHPKKKMSLMIERKLKEVGSMAKIEKTKNIV
jgi:hypothetical protein